MTRQDYLNMITACELTGMSTPSGRYLGYKAVEEIVNTICDDFEDELRIKDEAFAEMTKEIFESAYQQGYNKSKVEIARLKKRLEKFDHIPCRFEYGEPSE